MKVRSKIGVSALLIVATSGYADQFHYQNTVVGDRAMGLAGAYCAVADDASGVVYNPAGLAFSLSNDVSGSANAFTFKEVKYLKTIGESDFTENSAGKFAPFLGALQKLDHIMPGLVFAFGFWSSDSELKDQNDEITLDPVIPRFHRTVNLKASTDYIGAAIAKRFGSTISLGIGANYVTTDELLQEYQDALTLAKYDADTGAALYKVLTQNIRQRLTASGIEPTLGMQMVLGKFSVGALIKYPIMMSQEYKNTIEQHSVFIDSSRTVSTDPTYGGGLLSRLVQDDEEENPIGSFPSEYRLGAALFASTNLMWSVDVIHRTAAEGDVSFYDRNAVTNFATGIEWYATSSLPLRFGYFTNYDARADVEEGLTDQRDHIDYQAASAFLAWVQPNSAISVGAIYQMGSGQAQKIARDTSIQDVTANFKTYAFSATHNF